MEILLLLVELRLEKVKWMFFLSLKLHSLKDGKYTFLFGGGGVGCLYGTRIITHKSLGNFRLSNDPFYWRSLRPFYMRWN